MTRRISSTLHVESDEIRCTACNYMITPTGTPWKQAAALNETPMRGAAGIPYSGGKRVVLRRFVCPNCGTLLDSETALPEDPFLHDILFD